MSTRTRRRLQLPETFAATTIGVFTVASFACGTSGSSSTGMGGASSSSGTSSKSSASSASSASIASIASIASSSSGSSTCTPDGGMCVMADGGDQQRIYGCLDFGADGGCPTGLVCTPGDCPMNCEALLYIYCPSDAGCQPSNLVFGCFAAPDAGAVKCPSDFVCSADDCPPGCIGEEIA